MIGIVAIGRNEGERLGQCLQAVAHAGYTVVYVDSNSTDGSVALARRLGAHVVELDMSVPFTAARARNEGLAKLLELAPATAFVQFADGDCEIQPGWIPAAMAAMDSDPELAVACGRRRERFPEASIYNQLCDIEWDTPVGTAKYCGGDALVRVSAVKQVNGYNPAVIAGEEPELCVRLRQRGWRILRLNAEMTLHDAAMTRFSQWWKRTVRSGHAYAEGAALHGAPPERHWVKEKNSNDLYGIYLPILALGLAYPTRGISLILLAAYPYLTWKVYRYGLSRRLSPNLAALYARFITLGKFPSAWGQMKFRINRLLHRRARIIEYKSTAAPSPATTV